jgi:hexokinase
MSNAAKRILVLDIGGTNVKMIASGALEPSPPA